MSLPCCVVSTAIYDWNSVANSPVQDLFHHHSVHPVCTNRQLLQSMMTRHYCLPWCNDFVDAQSPNRIKISITVDASLHVEGVQMFREQIALDLTLPSWWRCPINPLGYHRELRRHWRWYLATRDRLQLALKSPVFLIQLQPGTQNIQYRCVYLTVEPPLIVYRMVGLLQSEKFVFQPFVSSLKAQG